MKSEQKIKFPIFTPAPTTSYNNNPAGGKLLAPIRAISSFTVQMTHYLCLLPFRWRTGLATSCEMEAEDPTGTPKNLLCSRLNNTSIDQPSTSSSVVSLSGHLPFINTTTQQHLTSCGHSCSDDSGCLVQNSSMSSGDSSRVYLNCKADFEVKRIVPHELTDHHSIRFSHF